MCTRHIQVKELSFCHKLWVSNFNIVATQCRRPLIFQTLKDIDIGYKKKLNLWKRLNSFWEKRKCWLETCRTRNLKSRKMLSMFVSWLNCVERTTTFISSWNLTSSSSVMLRYSLISAPDSSFKKLNNFWNNRSCISIRSNLWLWMNLWLF